MVRESGKKESDVTQRSLRKSAENAEKKELCACVQG
jgi:hypothetical protein